RHQADCGRQQRLRNARRHHRKVRGLRLRNADEAVHDSPHRAEQADERRGRADGRQHARAAHHQPSAVGFDPFKAGSDPLLDPVTFHVFVGHLQLGDCRLDELSHWAAGLTDLLGCIAEVACRRERHGGPSGASLGDQELDRLGEPDRPRHHRRQREPNEHRFHEWIGAEKHPPGTEVARQVRCRDEGDRRRRALALGQSSRWPSRHQGLSALDMNTNTNRARVDDKISPHAAVIVKPIETVSFYAAYSVSYLPASGDQFSALNNGTVILQPQKFENKEVGVKWNIFPRLLFAAAVYDLERTNVPLADPNNPGFFILSGSNRIRGFESSLNGYVTADWQSSFGYAYTDARVTSNTSTTIVAGNRIQLVPFHQFSWWNKYQIDPTWAASVGLIYFSDSF